MRFSVIIPMLNAAGTLAACLASVLDQDLDAPFEVFVIDNGSTDESRAVCAGFPAVRLLHCPFPGSYAARNVGLAQASGEAVAFLDSDCQPERDWLSSFQRAFGARDVLLGSRSLAGQSANLRLLEQYENIQVETIFAECQAESYFGYTNNLAVRREVFARLGGFAEVMRGADTLFVQRAARELGWRRIGYCPQARIRHLELTGLSAYLGKKWLYGQSAGRYPGHVWCRPLSLCQRLTVYRKTCRQLSLGWAARVRLLGLIGLGLGVHELGRLRGWSRRPH